MVEQRLMAIMHARHPLARSGSTALRLRDCAEYPVVLASLRGRQLPVIAYAFAEFLRKRLGELGGR